MPKEYIMKNIIILILISFLFASCATTTSLTRGSQYPMMYEEKPISILIMPPINNTVHVEAKEYFYTSLNYPLCEKGYYVISPFLAMDMFQSESAYDSEMFINGSLTSFRNVFGADAALFTIINEWEKSKIGSSIKVKIEYILKSTKTGEILFERQGDLTVDCGLSTGNLLVDIVASAINTALTDNIIAARSCNTFILQDLPCGKYSSSFGKDASLAAGNKKYEGIIKK